MKENLRIKTQDGMKGLSRSPNHTVLMLNRQGKRSYLWFGNEAPGDMMCWATLSGPATLRKLANAILAEVGKS